MKGFQTPQAEHPLGDHPTVLPHLLVGGIGEEVGICLAVEPAGPPGGEDLVDSQVGFRECYIETLIWKGNVCLREQNETLALKYLEESLRYAGGLERRLAPEEVFLYIVKSLGSAGEYSEATWLSNYLSEHYPGFYADHTAELAADCTSE